MANKKISELTVAGVLTGDEKLEVVQDGENRQTTAQEIADLGGDGGGAVSSVFGRTGAVIAVSNDYNASQIQNTAAGGISATNVQSALNELDTEKAPIASPTFTGTPAAPTPSPGDNTTKIATTAFVQNALSGSGVSSFNSRTGAVLPANGDYTATQVTNTPSGNIAAVTAQAAINELDTEKVAKAGDTMTGDLAFGGTQKNTGLAAGTAAGHSLRYEQVYLIPITPSVVANAFTWDCGGLMTPEADVSLSASATMTMTNIKAGSTGILRVAIGTASQVNLTFATTGGLTHKSQNTTFTVYAFPIGNSKEYYITFFTKDGTNIEWVFGVPGLESLGYALSDESTPLTIGVKLTDRVPYPFHVTAVRISLTTAQTSSSFVTVDVKKNGVSILSTLVSIDNNEKTSVTAVYPVVISTPDFADDDEVQFSVTQVGITTVAAGLKARLIGYKI